MYIYIYPPPPTTPSRSLKSPPSLSLCRSGNETRSPHSRAQGSSLMHASSLSAASLLFDIQVLTTAPRQDVDAIIGSHHPKSWSV